MAGVFSTTITFPSSSAVTPAKLNQIATGSSFTADAVFGTTLAVVGGQLKVGTITASEMGAASVGTTALASNAVTTAKISDGNVTAAKLASDAVTAAKIANGVITFAKVDSTAAATQANMQSETANKFVSPDVMKYHDGVAKAHGVLQIAASRSWEGSAYYNFATITRVSSTETRVNLASNMNNTSYTVQATYEDTTGGTGAVSVYDRNTGYFRVTHPAEGTGKKVHLTVHGRLA
jgi:hypothetical protein